MTSSHLARAAAWAALSTLALAGPAQAQTFAFSFSGTGVSGHIVLTYGTATDAKYPNAFEVTGISGSFTDTNEGLSLVNVPIGALVPITRDAPEHTNLLAPNDFSRFPVATGLQFGVLSYDNLLWPAGSPQTASDYPGAGGFLDIYGLLFTIGDGQVVNLWSNGADASGLADYGVAVATSATALNYVAGGVAAVPEPQTWALLAGGALAVLAWRRRSAPRAARPQA